MKDKKKIIAIVVGVIATIALIFLGLKLFGGKTNITTQDKNIDTSKFPATLSNVIEGEGLGDMNTAFFHHKYTDKYSVFCTQFQKNTPAGHSCKIVTGTSQWGSPTAAAIAAIIDYATSGTNGKVTNMNKYYYAELGINQFLWEQNGSDPNSSQKVGNIGNSSEVQELVALAKKASAKAKATFDVTVSPSNPKLTQKGNYYVSDTISVKDSGGYLDSYNVSLSGVTGAEVVNKTASSFKVQIPVANVKTGTTATLTVKVTGKKSYKIAAKYDCGSSYQAVTPSYIVEEVKTDSATVKITTSRTKITIGKVDGNGNNIAGAVLNLKSADGSYNKDFTTKTSPIVIEDLPYGTYTLSETKAPNGYIESSETKKLVLSEKTLSLTGTITNIKNGFTVSKRSKATSAEIAGAVLQITDANGKVIDKWTTTNTKKSFSGYTAGTYYLEELQAPAGYVKFTDKIKFVVGTDGKITTNSGSDSEVVLVNEPNQFVVSKRAIDIDGEIPGAVLRIVDANGKEITKWTTTSTKKSISMLPVGTYYLEEVQAPSGYKKSDVRVKFVLDENGKITTNSGSATEVVFVNDPIEATFSKTDITSSEELPGAQLQILDENEKEIKDSKGEVLYTWISTDKPYVISKIPAGKYVLVETQEPDGYVLSEEKIEFEIKNDGTVDMVVMLNTPIVEVPNTASAASIIISVIGCIAIGFGGWMIYRNVKKPE